MDIFFGIKLGLHFPANLVRMLHLVQSGVINYYINLLSMLSSSYFGGIRGNEFFWIWK